MAPGRGFEPLRPKGPQVLQTQNLSPLDVDGLLASFKQFCEVDLQLRENTVKGHAQKIRRFFKSVKKDPGDVTDVDIRNYLAGFKEKRERTRANLIIALRRFFRDFMRMGEVVESFRLPHTPFKPKTVPTREDVQKFYAALKSPRERAIFLMYATTGLRKHELISLALKEIDLERRTVLPKGDCSRTKRTWATFCNEESEQALREYLNGREGLTLGSKLFSEKAVRKTFKKGKERTGVHITPQILRDWFCSEMGELGVADRYVDAFCGRVPRSVLARHYTDFSPERLKRIYDKAGLKVLV